MENNSTQKIVEFQNGSVWTLSPEKLFKGLKIIFEKFEA